MDISVRWETLNVIIGRPDITGWLVGRLYMKDKLLEFLPLFLKS